MRPVKPKPPPPRLMQLREYQSEALEKAREQLALGRRKVLIVMPTGGGKTCTAAEACRQHVNAKGRVLWVAHRRELIKQGRDTLERYGMRVGAFGLNSAAPVQVESIQSLVHPKRREVPPATLVVADEAHHLLAEEWRKLAEMYSECLLIGLTATPERGDGQPLGDIFDALVVAAQMSQLIAMHELDPSVGLVPCDVKRPVHDDGSPWVLRSDEVAQHPVEAYQAFANGERAVVFAPNVPAAREFSDAFNAAGIASDIVHSKMPKDERDSVLKLFERGELRVVCNVNILCLDEETEILTARGWVGIDDGMCPEDLVANWNEGKVTFERPLEIIRRDRGPEERMVSLEGSRVSIRVTEGHRMLYRTSARGSFLKKAARDLIERRLKLPVSGQAEPMNLGVVTVPKALSTKGRQTISRKYHISSREGVRPPDTEAERRIVRERAMYHADPKQLSMDECRLIGFFVGDGTIVCPRKGGIDHQMFQTMHYPRIVRWLDGILKRLDIEACRREKPYDGGVIVKWSLPRGTGGGSQERRGIFRIQPFLGKKGTQALWGLNGAQFDAFIEGLWMANGNHGDGTPANPRRSRVIHSTRRELLSLVQAIASVRGYGTRLFTRPPNEPHHKPVSTLALRKKTEFVMGKELLRLETDWRKERVWCVRTRTKNIITRRRGTVVVMGNSEGWDDPGCSVCILARGCEHAGLYIQMVGRVMRPFPNKNRAILIDLRGVSYIHGLPAADREFRLEGVAIEAVEVEEEKHCPMCGRIIVGRKCPNEECNKIGEAQELKTPHSVDAQLVHVDWDEKMAGDPISARTVRLAEWFREAREKGQKAQNAVLTYKRTYGFYPRRQERTDAMLLAGVDEKEIPPETPTDPPPSLQP